MKKYRITINFEADIDASNIDEAEKIAWSQILNDNLHTLTAEELFEEYDSDK